MMDAVLELSELQELLSTASTREDLSLLNGCTHVVVDLRSASQQQSAGEIAALLKPFMYLSCPVIALADQDETLPELIDVVALDETDLRRISDAIRGQPVASALLMQLLRHNEAADIRQGLFAESLGYSTLQHGSTFEAWLAARVARSAPDERGEPVLLEREGGELTITLNRPDRHNAWSASLRDAFCEALLLVETDPGIGRAVVCGAGKSFCAGGDLD